VKAILYEAKTIEYPENNTTTEFAQTYY